jgi:hypothetical protein
MVPPKTPGSVKKVRFGKALAEALGAMTGQQVTESQRTRVLQALWDTSASRCAEEGCSLPALDRLGIPRSSRVAGFHTFRHSVGNFINAETGNLELAQKLLGHSNINTTADIYTHVFDESQRETARAVERAIYGDLFPVVPKMENGNKAALVN